MKKNIRTPFQTRQYMLSQDFESYYYSTRNQKHVLSHTHNYYEFYFFLSGDISIEIDGTDYPLIAKDVVIIPPNTRHNMNNRNTDVPYNRFVFWISQSYYEQLTALSADYGYAMNLAAKSKQYVFHPDNLTFNSLQSRILRLIEEQQGNRFGKDAQLHLNVCDLVLNLNREIYKLMHPATAFEEQSLYQNLLAYIENHLDEPLLLDNLSKKFYVSKYHLSHIFKENLGIPLHQYIVKKRLQICKDAILTQGSINDAALQCGFQDYSSFFRAFKKEYGVSPKEYRENACISRMNTSQ